MKDMPYGRYLARKKGSGMWWFQRAVPKELQERVGAKLVKHSLGTPDKKEAARLALFHATKLDGEWGAIRRELSRDTAPLTEADVPYITDRRKVELWSIYKDAGLESSVATGLESSVATGLEVYTDEVRDTLTALQKHDAALPPHVQRRVETALEDAKLSCPSDLEYPLFRRLVVSFLEAELATLEKVHRRFILDMHEDAPETPPYSPPSASTLAPGASTRPTLSAMVDIWAKEHERGGGAVATAKEYRATAQRFIELHGDLPVDTVTKAHVRQFREAVLRIPKQAAKRYPSKTLPELVKLTDDAPDIPRLSVATVNNKYLSALQSIFQRAEDDGYVEDNPAVRVRVKKAKSAPSERYHSFTLDDLQRYFTAPVYAGASFQSPAMCGDAAYWAPLLALFSGARLGEVMNLPTANIQTADGITYMAVGEDYRVKTGSSVRWVPIKSFLLRDLGLAGYLERLRSLGADKLFPLVTSSNPDKPHDRFQKWHGRYLVNKVGIDHPRKKFHSFRPTAIDEFRRLDVPRDIYQLITGHKHGSNVGDDYGDRNRVLLRQKAEAVEAMEYPGLDLSHLLPWPEWAAVRGFVSR